MSESETGGGPVDPGDFDLGETPGPEGPETEPEISGNETRPWDMLWNTTPEKPLDQVDSPWDPEKGGLTRVKRGVMKMGDFDGTPAILDIGVGIAEFVVSQDLEAPQSGGSDNTQSSKGDSDHADPITAMAESDN